MQKQIDLGYFFATDLADFLVKKLDYQFRKAHEIVGGLILDLNKNNKIADLEAIQKYLDLKSIKIDSNDLKNILDPAKSILSKNVLGSPSPDQVKKYIQKHE